MIWVVVMLVLAYAGTVGGFLVYLKGLNQRADQERQQLLNRIQAPQEAVGVSLAGDVSGQTHIGVGLEGIDDDIAFQDHQELMGR